jgi:hypothetical protein
LRRRPARRAEIVHLKQHVGSVVLLVLAACTGSLSDADLLSYSRSSFDKRAMEGRRVVLGVHRGVPVVADFPCADVCPANTVRVIHYDIVGETECTRRGGAPRTEWVPEGIGNVPRIFCLPSVLAIELDRQAGSSTMAAPGSER